MPSGPMKRRCGIGGTETLVVHHAPRGVCGCGGSFGPAVFSATVALLFLYQSATQVQTPEREGRAWSSTGLLSLFHRLSCESDTVSLVSRPGG